MPGKRGGELVGMDHCCCTLAWRIHTIDAVLQELLQPRLVHTVAEKFLLLCRECAVQQLNNSSSFENLAPDSQPQVKKLDLSPLVRIAKEYSGTLYSSSSSSSSSSQRCKCKSTQRSGCFPQAENWVASEQAWPIRTELQNAQNKLGMCKIASKRCPWILSSIKL